MENNCDIYNTLIYHQVGSSRNFFSHTSSFFSGSVVATNKKKYIQEQKNFSNTVRSRSIWIDWDNSLLIRFVFIQLKLQTGTTWCFLEKQWSLSEAMSSFFSFNTFAILYMVVSTNAGFRLWYRWHFGDDDNEMTFSSDGRGGEGEGRWGEDRLNIECRLSRNGFV